MAKPTTLKVLSIGPPSSKLNLWHFARDITLEVTYEGGHKETLTFEADIPFFKFTPGPLVEQIDIISDGKLGNWSFNLFPAITYNPYSEEYSGKGRLRLYAMTSETYLGYRTPLGFTYERFYAEVVSKSGYFVNLPNPEFMKRLIILDRVENAWQYK